MPNRDLDERFSLHPLTGEQVLRRLLGVEDETDSEGRGERDADGDDEQASEDDSRS